MKRLVYLFLILTLLFVAQPVQAAAPAFVAPGLCRVKADMELEWVNGIHTNYHSRLLSSSQYGKLTETTATVLEGGSTKGNVQYPQNWINATIHVINAGPNSERAGKYLFRQAGGIQNSEITGRMQAVTTEGNYVKVLSVSGNRAYIWTYHTDDAPPAVQDLNDPRIQHITTVNRLDQLTRATDYPVYFPLMARPGEQIWLDTKYLDCTPLLPRTVTVQTWPQSLNIRATPGGQWIGSYQDGEKVQVTALQTVAGNVWGQTWRGWVALYYDGRRLTDWKITP